jgi:S1-C subfamily serine protease
MNTMTDRFFTPLTTETGPLFNDQGQVIGINFAILRDFGGSNFAIPVRSGESILKP